MRRYPYNGVITSVPQHRPTDAGDVCRAGKSVSNSPATAPEPGIVVDADFSFSCIRGCSTNPNEARHCVPLDQSRVNQQAVDIPTFVRLPPNCCSTSRPSRTEHITSDSTVFPSRLRPSAPICLKKERPAAPAISRPRPVRKDSQSRL